MISIGQLKLRNVPAKLFAFGPKMKRILENFKKILSFLIKISMENGLFSHFFTKTVRSKNFCTGPEKIINKIIFKTIRFGNLINILK